MTIDEKIKELEEKLEEIKKENKKSKKEKDNTFKRWRAENGGTYYYIDYNGDILIDTETFDETSDFCYLIGNYFKTKEQAEISKQNRLTYQQLKDIALKLNKGLEIDWNDELEPKYYLCYAYYENNKILTLVNYTQQVLGVVYCLNNNFHDAVLEEIGEEKLKQLLEWGI